MERYNCIICDGDIRFLYRLDNMPASLSVTKQEYEYDIYKDQEIYECNSCSCVLIKKLIEPSLLYEISHNITYNLPTWNDHHNQFIDFILKTCISNSVLEIGGSSGALYDKIKGKKKYSCLDLCAPSFDISDINYMIGNCEDVSFEDTSCIIMSHVFEHLYDPKKFINNVAKYNVQKIYISIPNMMHLLEEKSLSVLHFEHTFFIDKIFASYLFSEKGYDLIRVNEFKKHSLFMEFEKTNCKTLDLYPRHDIPSKMLSIYNEKIHKISQYRIKPNSFIVPAGHMGQLIYHLIKPVLLGFLDNDTSKQNNRQYGTPYMIYPVDKIKEYGDINVYIYAGPYLNELLTQLNKYKNINIIIL